MLYKSVCCLVIGIISYQTPALAQWTSHIHTVKRPTSWLQYCSGCCSVEDSRSSHLGWECSSAGGTLCALDCRPPTPIPLCATRNIHPAPRIPPSAPDCCCCGS